MTNQVNKVLEKIREVCDLKRLEFGATVIAQGALGSDEVIYLGNKNGQMIAAYKEDYAVHIFPQNPELIGSSHNLIGLPVQLNHLLWALNKYSMPSMLVNRVNNIRFDTADSDTPLFYSLEKSVEDNLRSNPELNSWVHGVIIGKE